MQDTKARVQTHNILMLIFVKSSAKYFYLEGCAKGTNCCSAMATLNTSNSYIYTSNIKRERIVGFRKDTIRNTTIKQKMKVTRSLLNDIT